MAMLHTWGSAKPQPGFLGCEQSCLLLLFCASSGCAWGKGCLPSFAITGSHLGRYPDRILYRSSMNTSFWSWWRFWTFSYIFSRHRLFFPASTGISQFSSFYVFIDLCVLILLRLLQCNLSNYCWTLELIPFWDFFFFWHLVTIVLEAILHKIFACVCTCTMDWIQGFAHFKQCPLSKQEPSTH